LNCRPTRGEERDYASVATLPLPLPPQPPNLKPFLHGFGDGHKNTPKSEVRGFTWEGKITENFAVNCKKIEKTRIK